MHRRGKHPRQGERRLGLEGYADAGMAIFKNHKAGANIDDIMQWFDGLDREQVKVAIEFAVEFNPSKTP
jgi:hypothetical protein